MQEILKNTPASVSSKPRYIFRFHWRYVALSFITGLTWFLHFFQLDKEGFANLYYAATVRSMLSSWPNFFFGSFDPGGFVTVDKPPMGFWVQTASAWVFGYNGWSLLLPQALAGVISVLLLYHLVCRVFGYPAGLLAALVLALTPVSVAANRNNTMDSQLVLVLLLTTWALCYAAEQKGRIWWLAGAFALLGIGFNIKMLQAFMVLPAFYLFYFVAGKGRWWIRFLQLGATTLLLLVISLAWPIFVDMTPTDQRPFIGSSRDNTVMELIVGHNGLTRLFSPNRANLPTNPIQPLPGYQPAPGGQPKPGLQAPAGGRTVQPFPGGQQPGYLPPPNGQNLPFQPVPGLQPQPGILPQPVPGQPGGAQSETGEPGLFRMFNRQLAGQVSWLLPLALLGFVGGVLRYRLSFPLGREHGALLFWVAWVVPQLVFFSFGNLFHRYYLEMLSPGIAALAGIGLILLWRSYSEKKWHWFILPLALTGSFGLQWLIVSNYPEWREWLLPLIAIPTVGAISILIAMRFVKNKRVIVLAAAGLGMAGLLVAPGIWSLTPVLGSANSGLPFAGPELLKNSKQTANVPSSPLTRYVLTNQATPYLLATQNANTAAPVIIQTGKPVMALGGFSGGDRIVTLTQLQEMIRLGQVRFFLVQSQNGPTLNDLSGWVRSNCKAIPAAQWQGNTGQNNGPLSPPRLDQGQSLYDCAALIGSGR